MKLMRMDLHMRAATNPLTVALADAAKGLAQQMVFWGRDVMHPDGNALVRFGFSRNPSTGLQGTSCYAMPWEEGIIELHGAVASWVSHSDCPGCIFCRRRRTILVWNQNDAPIPGEEAGEAAPSEIRWKAFQPFLRWLIAYENWSHQTLGAGWRAANWKALRRLPAGKPWLQPPAALRWWNLALVGNPPRPSVLTGKRKTPEASIDRRGVQMD